MASTPQRGINEVKSPGQFSPVAVQESPVSKTPQRGNLTGHPRVIRDYAADAYNLIQKWNTHQILGGRIIKNIVTLKTALTNEDNMAASQIYPSGLQEHCDQLGEVCTIMKEVATTLKLIHKQTEAIIKLEKLKGIELTPMFISWPAEKFGEVLLDISEAYGEELKVKLCVQQNIAHTRSKATLMLHAAAWAHQPYITPRMDLAMESLLQETGHRSIGCAVGLRPIPEDESWTIPPRPIGRTADFGGRPLLPLPRALTGIPALTCFSDGEEGSRRSRSSG